MSGQMSCDSNAASAARMAFSEGKPIEENLDSETPIPLHKPSSEHSRPEATKNKKLNVASLYDTIVYVKVGPEQLSFGIHKGLICHHSSYFDRALNGGFKEAVRGEISLDDEKPKTFARFNGWLYTGSIFLEEETAKDIIFTDLVDLFIFAEMRGVILLQNTVVDAIIRKNSFCQTLPCVRRAWTNTADSSPLHTLLVDLYVRKANFSEIMSDEKKNKSFDKDILMAIVLAFHRLKAAGSFDTDYDFWKRRCLYHTHDDRFPPCSIAKSSRQKGVLFKEPLKREED